MAITQVQFLSAAGLPASGVLGQTSLPTGLEGLFAQLVDAAAFGPQPLTPVDAANIAESLPRALTQQLPSDPEALTDLLNHVTQALTHGDIATVGALLPGTTSTDTTAFTQTPPTTTPVTTLTQNLPRVRSTLVVLQPQELQELLNHENQALEQLGVALVNPATGFDPDALTRVYVQAGLTPTEAVVRANLVTQVADHLASGSKQPITLAIPTAIVAEEPPVVPLPTRPQVFLQALRAAAQTTAPEGVEVVDKILSLTAADEDLTDVDATAAVDSPISPPTAPVVTIVIPVQNPAAGHPPRQNPSEVTPTNVLSALGLPSADVTLTNTLSQADSVITPSTPAGQIVDATLGHQPATPLLASVDRTPVVGGAAVHSGAAPSVAAGAGANDFSSDDDSRGDVLDFGRSIANNHEASALSFDRFLGQKLQTPTPVTPVYNAQGQVLSPSAQVNISMRQLANNGGGKIRIKLSPEELGRVDIRLEIHNHQVRGVIMVERPEVMQDLARDLKGLQQALAASGLTVADNGLSFQMQNQGGGDDKGQASTQFGRQRGGLTDVAGVDENSFASPALGRWRDVNKLVDVNI